MKATRTRIIEASQSLLVGAGEEVARDVWLQRLGRDDDKVVFAWCPGLGGNLIEIFVRLFSDAIAANTKKLGLAAECGFETCLLMTPEWLPHGPRTLADVYDAIRDEHSI